MSYPSACVHELLYAKLEALLAEFDTVADHAAFGETVNDLDTFLLVERRAFIKEIFQQKLQEHIAKKMNESPERNAVERRDSSAGSIRSLCYAPFPAFINAPVLH